ncbi:MAG: hypothetical protein Q9222_007089 [Ikaeria aurantiellina]
MAYDKLAITDEPPATDFDVPNAKRRKLGLAPHHHDGNHPNGVQQSSATLPDDEAMELLLARSISLALEAVGFEASEALALDSFRLAAESYIHSLLGAVRQSMLSCRRSQPTVQDFLQSLHTHQLSLRALVPHLKPPVSRKLRRIELAYEDEKDGDDYTHLTFNTNLEGTPDDRSRPYIPHRLPTLPGRHTYKATADYPVREEDPRKVRERATEEGRLGEEALRRLVSAGAVDQTKSTSSRRHATSLRTKRHELWKATMQATSSVHSSDKFPDTDELALNLPRNESQCLRKPVSDFGRISSAVNADKRYWRKPATAQASSQVGSNGAS